MKSSALCMFAIAVVRHLRYFAPDEMYMHAGLGIWNKNARKRSPDDSKTMTDGPIETLVRRAHGMREAETLAPRWGRA
jgi:hypothetical protein